MPFTTGLSDPGTRLDILLAAGRLFAERGFANVSIREICDAAGITPPTLYYYFGNKDRLFEAVIRNSLNLDDFRDVLAAALARRTDPAERLKEFIYQYMASMPRGFFNPGMFLDTTTNVSEISVGKVRVEFASIDEMACEIIDAGIQQEDFKPVDLKRATEFLMNLLMAYVIGEVHFGQSHDPSKTAEFIHEIVLNGLRSNL